MMFNSLNSKGMPLTDPDIISAQMYANAGADKNDFNQKWKKIQELTESLENKKITDITGILQQYMYIDRASRNKKI